MQFPKSEGKQFHQAAEKYSKKILKHVGICNLARKTGPASSSLSAKNPRLAALSFSLPRSHTNSHPAYQLDVRYQYFTSLFFFFFPPQVFQGNTNPTDVAKTMLPKPTLTRFIRIRPVTWETGIALRFEVYGCKISGGYCWDCPPHRHPHPPAAPCARAHTHTHNPRSQLTV